MFCSSLSRALRCLSCLLVYLLTVIFIFISCDIPQNYKYVNSFGLVMPVTTRSQARLLFNACNDNHQVCMECSPVLPRVSEFNQSLSSRTIGPPLNNTDLSPSLSIIPGSLRIDSSTGDPFHWSLPDQVLISNSAISISKFQKL